jgi:aerobic-type carbon monoxide dehydrogenase small subunit (CoxS/CutS family)
VAKILVMHRYFGCDTGCCGHCVEIDGKELPRSFDFAHPYDDDELAFAEKLIRSTMGDEHVKDLDWEHSVVMTGDWCG